VGPPQGTFAILLNNGTECVIQTARRLLTGEIYVPDLLTPSEEAA
jgi:hypothetical protein